MPYHVGLASSTGRRASIEPADYAGQCAPHRSGLDEWAQRLREAGKLARWHNRHCTECARLAAIDPTLLKEPTWQKVKHDLRQRENVERKAAAAAKRRAFYAAIPTRET